MPAVSDPRQVTKVLAKLPKAVPYADLLGTPPTALVAIYHQEEIIASLLDRIAQRDPDFMGNALGEQLREIASQRRVIGNAYRGCTSSLREIRSILEDSP